MTSAVSQSVLKGIRILDFSWVLAGPFATRLLADFGAEVIKIQPCWPEAGEKYSRAYYNSWNRNKLGLSLDLSKPQGGEIVRRLVKISDAVVENFSPRVMTNWKLDYPELKKLKADIILLSLSMTGHSGPLRHYSGFGPAVQALAGMTYLTSEAENDPVGLGFAYSDHVAGLYGALALQGALEYRDSCGEGQFIDLSQTETMLSLIAEPFFQLGHDGKALRPEGNRSEFCAPQGVYACLGRERWCAITVSSEEEWRKFKTVLGSPAWAEARRFSSLALRLKNQTELDRHITVWTQQHSVEKVADLMQSAGIAAETVKNVADLATDPALNERGFFVHLEHPELGDTISEASPIHLSETPAHYHRAAPFNGQDNEHILGSLLGMSKSEIAKLKEDQVI